MLRFNDKNEVITEEKYTAILVGLQLNEDITYSMNELEGLVEADNIESLGLVVQTLEKPNKATLIGKGKVSELAEMCEKMEADMVVFNDTLSGMQLRNLEEALNKRVIDRNILILDIFANRAISREGKLQVELAQLQYRMPRLTGFGKSLSRLGGGIGTRGPGEKKLESDRRHIASRIDDIKAELKKMAMTRNLQREGREKSNTPIVALMGYTNSGKSAIMNALLERSQREEKTVHSKDMLFATLDTQHRKISLERGNEFILIDTVGFVSRLPHALIEAFKSTLEEVRYADLLIQVVDSSYDGNDFHIKVTKDVIREIGASDKSKIMAYNKIDLTQKGVPDIRRNDIAYISAKTGEGIDELLEKIKVNLFGSRLNKTLLIPYNKGDILSYICENANVISMDHKEMGTVVDAELSEEDFKRYAQYVVEKNEDKEQ